MFTLAANIHSFELKSVNAEWFYCTEKRPADNMFF